MNDELAILRPTGLPSSQIDVVIVGSYEFVAEGSELFVGAYEFVAEGSELFVGAYEFVAEGSELFVGWQVTSYRATTSLAL